MPIVADSGPILSFARAGQLAVLQAVVVELFVPEVVYEEVVVGGSGRPGAKAIAGADWIVCQTLSDRSLRQIQVPVRRGWRWLRKHFDFGT